MTVTEEKTKTIESLIKEISKSNGEPPCITEHRLDMWKKYEECELPSRVAHLWKYSNPKDFLVDKYDITTNAIEPEFILSEEAKSKGVIFTDLKNAFKLEGAREFMKSKFSSLIDLDKMTLLNEAAWSSGYYLYVPDEVVVNDPLIVKIGAEFHSSQLDATKALIILGKNSSAKLIGEYQTCATSDFLSNVVIEMFLDEGAKLNYLNLQIRGLQTIQHLYHRAELKKGAELINLVVALGGKTTKSDIGFDLIGENASTNTYGIVLGDGEQRFDHHTALSHIAPNTKSGLDFRMALKDNAKSAYTGNLKIEKLAIGCTAAQENRNLLLSKTARAESIPELEILTEDVASCKHAVTVGEVNKDQIFYLMSRGLSPKESERLVIEGFLEPTISRIPDENLREEVRSRVKTKLASL